MKIDIKDAILHIDIFCYECKRRVAYSNTTEFRGRRYCNRCNEILNNWMSNEVRR